MKAILFAVMAVALMPVGEAQKHPVKKQEAPAPKVEEVKKPEVSSTKESPAVPLEYQKRLMALVIQQKDIQAHETQLQAAFAEDLRKMTDVNAKGKATEHEMFLKIGLDPDKFTVIYQDEEMKIVSKEQEKK